MKSKTTSLFLAMPVAIIAGSILWCERIYGQILPDNTLGPESSVVTPAVTNGIESHQIDGGAVRGANLFHSFSEFNVNSGAAAYFANPSGIENILSRVTGGNISNIFGTLGVLGNANLFLINPAGIVFGPNARLDLGGSFVGTTADRLVFGNGFEFSATNPSAPPLLTIDIPMGLNLRQNQGAIALQGTGNPDVFPTEVSTGLAVAPGKTLALVGSDVTLTDAIVTAPSGRIEIGSVLDGNVSLTQSIEGIELGYSQVESFGEIKLLETSSVWNPNIIPNPSAGIFLHGGKVRLEGRSQIASVTVASSPGSNIRLNAAESLEVGGVDENIFPYSSWVVTQVAPSA
ncbi:MAG: filamentous hemagglutinin N-terminal domain-containing protein, partial [Hormoscilla sp.]